MSTFTVIYNLLLLTLHFSCPTDISVLWTSDRKARVDHYFLMY